MMAREVLILNVSQYGTHLWMHISNKRATEDAGLLHNTSAHRVPRDCWADFFSKLNNRWSIVLRRLCCCGIISGTRSFAIDSPVLITQ